MSIQYDEKRRLFRIQTGEMSYVFAVSDKGKLIHCHWGTPVTGESDFDHILADWQYMHPDGGWKGYHHTEYRSGEPFDFGPPALCVRHANGAETLRLVYRSHTVEKDTLSVVLSDTVYPLEVTLVYKTWADLPLLSRHVVIRNTGTEPVTLLSAKSATLDMAPCRKYRLTHFDGRWGMEYTKKQTMLTGGSTVLETRVLTEAAAFHMPFFALDENGTATETQGDVFFGLLQYSGDFQITADVSVGHDGEHTSITAGVSDHTAQIPLSAGESFVTPVLTCGLSHTGFGGMSEILYDWEFDHVLPRGKDTDKAHGVRPVIYNTWYPYEFNIDEEKILGFIPKAKDIGAELFVIDDGWMEGRSNDRCGLGDWILDKTRFPHGLGMIADRVHEAGMLFGLWVEPEMANIDSECYRTHPDWILREPDREHSLMRHQVILDMSREDVYAYTIDWLDKLIVEAKLDYLKWDMNRDATEVGLYALERGTAVRYMENIRRIWEHLQEKFPDLLLENCASGGGRADFGMLPYADRVNRSDNADPIDVLRLHEGYSMLFVPKLAGGAGNVAPSPYHLSGREAPLAYRTDLGMTGSMSVGINLLKSPPEELAELREAIARFKQLRPALQDAYVYRLVSPENSPYLVLAYTKRDKSQCTVFAFGHGIREWEKPLPRLRLRGLEPDARYRCGNRTMTGQALMALGITVKLRGDFAHLVETWVRVEE